LNEVVILVGGFGTRLYPLTLSTPKPIIPIFDKPFIEHQLNFLKKQGIKKIILCIGHKSSYFNKIKKEIKGIELILSKEKFPLGTGGPIKNAEKYIKEENFFVLNGDVFFDFSLREVFNFHKKNKSLATITLYPVRDVRNYGVVKTSKNGKILSFLEKPKGIKKGLINAGVYVFNKKVLNFIPENKEFSLEKQLFPHLLKNIHPFYGIKKEGYWIDIGTKKSYFKVHFDVLEGNFKKNFGYLKVKKGNGYLLFSGKNTKVEKVVFRGKVVLGNNNLIEKNVHLENVITLSKCKIEEGSIIKNSIIGNNCVIKKNAKVENVVLGDDTVIK
jgi:mannose-1-phosphate guanylyltransferase/phosphomannomutase